MQEPIGRNDTNTHNRNGEFIPPWRRCKEHGAINIAQIGPRWICERCAIDVLFNRGEREIV